jgi:glyoxylase-like metal-dependent hydrolase (beta-lactamase superfamily II)
MSQLIDAKIAGNSRVFFIKGDRTAIVDTGAPGNEWNILRALKDSGIPKENVSVIIVTHAHCDHDGSVFMLKAALGVPVIAGWPDAEYLENGENAPAMNFPWDGARAMGPKVDGVKADVIARDDMDLKVFGIDAKVLTTPGHTEGSLSVLASSGDCATGDFLASLYSGDEVVVKKSLKKLADNGAKRFYPSHDQSMDVQNALKIVFMAGE